MTDRMNTLDPARLDELSAVTKAYAQFSGAGIGLAAVAAGAWVLAAEILRGVAPRAGELLLVLAPLVLIGTTSAARAYYQRHGRVVATSDASPSVRVLMAACLLILALVGIAKQFDGPRRGYELLAVAAFVATAAIAVRRTFRWDISSLGAVSTLLGLATLVGHGRSPPWDGLDLAVGVMLVAGGVISHLRYRRIERRLAALKRASA